MRQWVDDSGSFRVEGRLILILDGKVRLLKETGRTTTVPLTQPAESALTAVAPMAQRQQGAA